LTGRHRTDCATCHGVGTFKRVASDCNSCHAEEYARAQRPEHLNAGYARSCEQCHSTNGWQPAKAASHPATFPLRNAHATARCDSCHTGPTYRGLQTVCASCHLPEYTNSQDPRHAAAQFATDCTQCHGDVAWRPAKYSHPPSFALTGAHLGRKCAACHTGAIYQGLPSGCNDCHAGAYNTSTNPRHGPAQLPKDCAQCHGDVTWRPANYSHPTSFPLTGAHLGQQCNACHTGTVYKGLPGKCVDCHLGDYQKTTNPNHTTAQFPTSCESCHATTRWTPATFNHKFPRTGDHNVSCKDCHTTPNNYTLFSCTHCHDHRKSEMDDEHKGVSGYQWLSTSCYTCHPQGRER
jgi:hypothetical protein